MATSISSIIGANIPIGPQGAQGIQGTQGPQGIQGTQGPQGIQGITGAGIQGPQGIQGTQGPQGIQGTQGPQGIQGTQGPQGIQGTQGPQGIQGTQGPQGIQGTQGPQGIQGTQGPQGIQGTQGPQGIQGQQGPQGIQGTQGPQGIQGTQGPQGIQGTQGPQGIQGTQGPQGIQGRQGPQGIQGTQGPQGIQGTQGPQGIQGVQGSQGIQGTQSAQGIQGQAGTSQGVQGLQGPAGGGGGSGSGNANVAITSTAPGTATANQDFWWDTNSGKLKIYYNDGTSTAWVDAFVAAQGPTGTQGIQGTTGSGSQGAQGTAGSGGTPGGSVGEIQYNDGAGGFAANVALAYSESIETLLAANVYITGSINSTSNSTGSLVINGGMGINGDIYMQGGNPFINMEGIASEPSAPAANNLIFYAKNIGGRMLPKFVGPSGFDTALQPLIGTNRFALWNPPPQVATAPGTTVGVNGISWTTNGTLTARTIATTNMFTRMKRLGFTTASGTNNIACGAYNANATYTIGTATTPALGGFYFIAKFGDQDTQATSRFFCGFSSSTTANIAGEPSTFTNAIGVGYGTADTNYKIFYGGSAAQTPIDLGSSFPCKLANTTPMEIILFAPPNSSNTVHYRLTVLSTGNTTSGTLTAATIGTQLPANTTLLGPRITKNNVNSGAATGFDLSSIYIESDY